MELIEYVKISQSTINLGTTFETVVYGLTESGVVFQEGSITIRSFEVDHRGFALGYELIFQNPTGEFIPENAEKLAVPKGPLWSSLAKGDSITLPDGKVIKPEDVTGPRPKPLKIVYSGDTRPCEALREKSHDADVLISEAMYTAEHADLAHERGHSTAEDVAKMASEIGVRLLVLTHYSPRYYDGSAVLNEAKMYFPNAILARDLLTISLDKDGMYSIKHPGTTPVKADQV